MQKMIEKISSFSGLGESEIEKKVQEKIGEFSGLISEEGAIHLIAKEFGVEIDEKEKIENISPNQNVNILAKILRVEPGKSFQSEKASGRLQNIILGDSTGTIKMTLWNDEIEKFQLTENETVQVKGFSKKDNFGNTQINLGKFGSISKTKISVPVKNKMNFNKINYQKSTISELKEGRYKIRASLLQIILSRQFLQKDGKEGVFVSGIIDDGTATIRAVFFNENAEIMLNLKKDEIIAGKEYNALLGEDYTFECRVKKNDFSDDLEMIINSVKKLTLKKR